MNIQAILQSTTQPSKHTQAVCFAVDNNFFPFAYFVALQLLEKHPKRNFDICICATNFSNYQEKLENTNIRFCQINIQGIGTLPTDHLSIAAYYRFFLPTLFQQDYQYILYLDADTYICKPFANQLFTNINQMIGIFAIAAAADISEIALRCDHSLSLQSKQNLLAYLQPYQQQGHLYRNSGVLLFHCQRFIEQGYLNQIFTTALVNLEKLTYHDQSALNLALTNRIALLPYIYNWQSNRIINHAFDYLEPAIIHFIREQKPWLGGYHKLPNRFYEDYHHFFGKHFPQLIGKVIKPSGYVYQKRLAQPKYQNTVKEFISRESARLKYTLQPNISSKKQQKEIATVLENFNKGNF